MFSKLPIKVSAPLIVGLPVLIVGVWLSVMWNGQAREAVTELADRNIEQIHKMTATKVVDVLSIPKRVCEVNGHLVRSGALPPAALQNWRPTLAQQARSFDMLSAISWGSADGRTAWVSRYADGSYFWALTEDASSGMMAEWRLNNDGTIAETPPSTFEFNLFSRPWFQAPHTAGQATWSDPFLWVGGENSEGATLGISYGIPLTDSDEEFLGVIDADFSLNDLSRYLGSIEIGRTGIAALTSGDGMLLAVSNDTPIVDSDDRLVPAVKSSNSLIAAAAGTIGSDRAEEDLQSQVSVDGEDYYIRASPIGREIGLDWSLITIVPESDFLAQIDAEFRHSWLASLLAVILAVALGLVAARWLISPLLKLVTAVRRIGQGDLETTVRVQHAPEYEKLAGEINKMTEGLQDRIRMRKSLSLAMEIQQNLLPEDTPAIDGLDIAGHSTYCDETGGDYYDFLDLTEVDDETAVIVVGDVVGHGIAAAMLMATARGILRSRCAIPGSLGDFLDHLNAMLVPDTRGERFMTMLLLTVSARHDELQWASAGHGPPIIFDANTETFLGLEGGGLPLGLREEEDYEEYVQPAISAGHLILAATDGLWETMNEAGTEFGMDRLQKLIRTNAHRPAAEISEKIRDALATFRGPVGQADDLTFVIVKVL